MYFEGVLVRQPLPTDAAGEFLFRRLNRLSLRLRGCRSLLRVARGPCHFPIVRTARNTRNLAGNALCMVMVLSSN